MANTDTTPMMKQYWAAKKLHEDKLLFFRMGDFYEMFFDDAKTASELLNITLTSRSKAPNAIPMAGVPVRSVKRYIRKLLEAGQHVAICEQLEDPSKTKSIVKRDVVRVITPGTMIDDDCMNERTQLYLLAVSPGRKQSGIAWIDLSTGEFSIFETDNVQILESEIWRIAPAECLVPEEQVRNGSTKLIDDLKDNGLVLTTYPDWNFGSEAAGRELKKHFGVTTLEGFGISRPGPAVEAAGALIRYLYETQMHDLKHISSIKIHQTGGYLQVDKRTCKALEVIQNSHGGSEGTLLSHLDRTCTSMGARLLRTWLINPLSDINLIEARHDAVQELSAQAGLCNELRHNLKGINDIERLSGKLALGSAHARDLLALGLSLSIIPAVKKNLVKTDSELIQSLVEKLDDFTSLREEICNTIVEAPPLSLKDGGLIRPGISQELDELHSIAEEGGSWLEDFQQRQIEHSGISNLKVGYHRVFGYYIEITRSKTDQVPPDYVRKQTLKNAERYITEELKDYETKVLTAKDRMLELEYNIFISLRDQATEYIVGLQETASALAAIDVLVSFAHIANLHNYVRPRMTNENILRLKNSRHPVLETNLQDETFVPNDIMIEKEAPIAIITGPNMAGKSTYIRQAAILVIMAQAGSFIAADKAEMGIVDRLFARVGAADDLYHGQSTFMVEMIETANILNNATSRSLIILDEVGRGTSTFDGLSIAWAVTEYIYENLSTRTLFATHYHELTELSLLHKGIINLNVAVKEYRDKVIFLRKIIKGSTDKSYGIHVARLAALPQKVLERAREILTNLECQSVSPNNLPAFAQPKNKQKYEQLDFFSDQREGMIEKLKKMQLNNTTPLEALNFLIEFQDKIV